MRDTDAPNAVEVAAAPELATLALLAAALDMAETVLLAAHPELNDLEHAARNGPLPVCVFLADSILRLGAGTAAALESYRRAVLPPPGEREIFDVASIDF